jgi:selenocysteine lyase/cysteine desulfurase
MTAIAQADVDSALVPVVGRDLHVPLVTGEIVRYVNLDYAASAPALQYVADHVGTVLPLYSSVHRGAGYASAVCTAAYESARTDIASFVGARADDVVIVTRNTTDALNLLATAVPGPVVHLDIEHHANLLPWQAGGARVVAVRDTVEATLDALRAELHREPAALLAVTGASNVTGECLPLPELAALAHAHGARLAVDGAQLVPHRRVDIAELGVDYLAFSGHKLYAPFGAGVLIGRRDWLDAAPPYLAGGGAVRRVTLAQTTWADSPARHEAGTPNVIGAVALAAACRSIANLPAGVVTAHETNLLDRLVDGLRAIDGVRTLRLWPGCAAHDRPADRIGVLTFTVEGVPAELVAQYLSAEHGIGVRDGRFCAHPLLDRLNPDGLSSATAVRASIGLGSQGGDIDRLVAAIAQLRRSGPAWNYAGLDGDYRPVPDPRPLPGWLGPAREQTAGTNALSSASIEMDKIAAAG